MGMYNCPDCKDKNKEYNETSSRHDSMMYHMQDYDRLHGKGAFKKKHSDSYKMMEELMDKKTKMLTDHMSHSYEEEAGEPRDEHKSVADIPVI